MEFGSGPHGKPLDQYFCANADVENKEFCLNKGTSDQLCLVCQLVGYCSEACQRNHSPRHESSCKQSRFRDAVWKPSWEMEARLPEASAPSESVRADHLWLWGNTPAFDLINFHCNEHKEGGVWPEAMRLVFAASGDFRSAVETLASVPLSYSQPIEIVINDREAMVAARNLLMTALLLLKGEEAIDTVINLWYSTGMGDKQYTGLVRPVVNDHLTPLVQNQLGDIRHCGSRVELNQMQQVLRLIFEMEGNTQGMQESIDLRRAKMLNPARRDHIDLHLLLLKEFHRQSFSRFHMVGFLLPHEWQLPHPNVTSKFIFHPNNGWVLTDTDEPKEGWDMIKVMEFGDQMRLPENDLYGRLFFYIRDRFTKMVATLRRIPVNIRFFQKDARDLAKKFKKDEESFDRIDVSNISDEDYVGINTVLDDWAPLLNTSNPNSAIVTLFHNWSDPNDPHLSPENQPVGVHDKTVQFLGLTSSGIHASSNDFNLMMFAIPIVTCAFIDHSEMFQEYLNRVLNNKPMNINRRMKHRIVPHRVMFPLEAPVEATLDCLDKQKQYFAFNRSTNIVDMNQFVEWGFK